MTEPVSRSISLDSREEAVLLFGSRDQFLKLMRDGLEGDSALGCCALKCEPKSARVLRHEGGLGRRVEAKASDE